MFYVLLVTIVGSFHNDLKKRKALNNERKRKRKERKIIIHRSTEINDRTIYCTSEGKTGLFALPKIKSVILK